MLYECCFKPAFSLFSFTIITRLFRLLRKVFLSLLAILCNSAFRWVYLSFSHLPFTSLLFSTCLLRQAHCLFAFLFLGDVLITASSTVLQTSIHSFLGTLSIRSKLLNVPLHHMLSLGIPVYFNFFCIF